MGAAAVPLAGVGLGLSALGGVSGMISGYQSNKFNAKMAERDAQTLDYRKADALKRLEKNEKQVAQDVASSVASVKTRAASGNVDVSIGSPVDVAKEAMTRGNEDISQLAENTRMELMGVQTQQDSLQMQAQLSRRRATAGLIGGSLSTAGNVLAGTAQVSDMAYRRGKVS